MLVLLLAFSSCEKTETITIKIVGDKSTFYGTYDIPKLKKEDVLALKEKQFASLDRLNSTLYSDLIKYIGSEVVEPQNSEIEVCKERLEFNYTPSKKGKRINVDKLYNDIIASLPSKNISLTASYVVIDEAVTVEDNKNRTLFRSSYKTSFHTSSENRKHNIYLATSFINGTVLNPLEKLSFNEVVGKRSEERGFKSAKIIANGKFVDGIGGGVCQVSTTLYDACILSGLKAVSVSGHSLPVSYVKPSFDAMVSSASDLVIQNPLDFPVYIFGRCENDEVEFSVFGVEQQYKIVAKSKVTEIVPYETEYSNEEEKIGKNGIKSYLKLIYFKDENKIFEEIIRRDYYKPQNEILIKND